MPRYFFHVYDGDAFLDDEGTFLPDLQQAKKAAVRAIIGFLGNYAESPTNSAWRLDIVNQAGEVLLSLRLDAARGQAALTYLLDVKPGPSLLN